MSAPAGLTQAELDAAKAYLRVSGTEDDQVVAQCVLAARQYLADAGVGLPAEGSPRRALYDLVAHSMALSGYDQRDPVIAGAVTENPQVRRMLTQLRFTEPVSKLDTGG